MSAEEERIGSWEAYLGLTLLRGGVAKRRMLGNPAWNHATAWFMFAVECIVTLTIVWRIPYTEIDWIAYMQEVGYVVKDNVWDYAQIKGDTGPLVYPSGFVYIYAMLYYVTGQGSDILLGQLIFVFLYLACVAVVLGLYLQCKECKPWMLIAVCVSRRVHSIFVLRLFNDGIAMLFLYSGMLAFMKRRPLLATFLCSWALSVKMNILLWAPAFALLCFHHFGWKVSIRLVGSSVIQAILLAAPFCTNLTHARHYWGRAFEFSRVFTQKWSVNWPFLPPDVFVSPFWAQGLLVCHCLLLCLFTLICLRRQTLQQLSYPAQWLFFGALSNFIGIVVARSLHYQFYTWYFHTLPFLLAMAKIPVVLKVLVFISIELVWNIYPPRAWAAMLLHGAHAVLLVGLWRFCDSMKKAEPDTGSKSKVA
jgi:alpha-1,3-mannosyltransferase